MEKALQFELFVADWPLKGKGVPVPA